MCSKLKKELEGLDRPTYPGELGKKVFNSVSKEAWGLWLKHMTMLINEYRPFILNFKNTSCESK